MATSRVALLVQRCQDEMLRSVCRAQTDPAAPRRTLAPGSTVFVAGVGPVDAQAYEDLRQAGERMCGTMRGDCTSAWDGKACQVARALWGKALPSS